MESIKPTRANIIFSFMETVIAGTFSNVTSWGFQTRDQKEDVKKTRWGIVNHVGPDVKGIVPGDYILIERLMWTHGFDVNGEKYWCTNQCKLFATSKVEPKGYT